MGRRGLLRAGLWPGLLLAVFWCAAWAGSTASRPGWFGSFAQSAEAVTGTSIVLWPLACGVGSAWATQQHRNGTWELLAAWPGAATLTHLARSLAAIWAIACSGGLVSLAAAGVIAGYAGSPPSPAPLSGFLIACLGVYACLAWGALAGTVVPSFLTAVAVLVAQYVVPWQLAALGIFPAMEFTGATALIGTAYQLLPGVVALHVAVLAGSAALFLIAAETWLRRGRMTPRQWLGTGLAATVLGSALVGLLAAVSHVHDAYGFWTDRGDHAWDCRPVGDAGSQACIPHDIGYLAEAQATRLAALDPHVRRVLAKAGAAPGTLIYAGAPDVAERRGPGAVRVPVEINLTDLDTSIAIDVSSFLILHPDVARYAAQRPGAPAPTGDCISPLESLAHVMTEAMTRDVSPGVFDEVTFLTALECG